MIRRYRQSLGWAGYTVIEVMIFLAVSMGLLAMVAGSFSGQETKTRFRQAVNAFDADMRDRMNDVSTGFYPTKSDFNCIAAPSTVDFNSTAPIAPQGSNSGCTFTGKLFSFSSTASTFQVFTMVGRTAETNFPNSSVKLLGGGSNPGVIDNGAIAEDLRVVRIARTGVSPAVTMNGFAVVAGFPVRTGPDQLASGNAARVSVWEYQGGIGSGPIASTSYTPATGGITLCMNQGGTSTSERVSLRISSEGRTSSEREFGWPAECN